LRTIKRKGRATEVIATLPSGTLEMIAQSPIALFHARATTQGTEDNNENNHPIALGDWTVVHNGVIQNDDDLFRYYKDPRPAEVDSIAIPLVLSKGSTYEESLSHLSVLGGSATAALWSIRQPHHIALFRLGHNDLYLYYRGNILYWSSSPYAGRLFVSTFLGKLPITQVGLLDTNRLLVLQPGGPQNTKLFTIERNPFQRQRPVIVGPPAVRVPVVTSPTAPPASPRPAGFFAVQLAGGQTPSSAPRLPSPNQFRWDAWDLVKAFASVHAGASTRKTFESPLGVWRFRKDNKDNAVRRTFKPFRRVKRAWRALRVAPSIPAEVCDGRTPFDGKQKVLTLEAKETQGTATWITDGKLCQWCGVWTRTEMWQRSNHRCSWCHITSEV